MTIIHNAVIHQGDCVDVMAGMEPESIDAIVCDPPYGLEFMGKEWDRLDGEGWRTRGGFSKPGIGDRSTAWTSFGQRDTANATCATCGGRMRGARKCECESPEWRVNGRPLDDPTAAQASRMQQWHQQWATAALRVAKPGAYLLAFGGTRTVHRLACAIEDAGWIIRDTLVWAYSSGFPKSRASLKPAWEPIVLARKPGPLRDLNIDECRIGTTKNVPSNPSRPETQGYGKWSGLDGTGSGSDPNVGRWPANVILTDPIFDGGYEGVVGADRLVKGGQSDGGAASIYGTEIGRQAATWQTADDGTPSRYFLIPDAPDNGRAGEASAERRYQDRGGTDLAMQPGMRREPTAPSRIFLIPKASRSDREPAVLPDEAPVSAHHHPGPERSLKRCVNCGSARLGDGGVHICREGCPEKDLTFDEWEVRPRFNTHPTVKPTALMRHLVRLVTPKGGIVLDPFMGSGSTLVAARDEEFTAIGIEREDEYVRIAEQRLARPGLGL